MNEHKNAMKDALKARKGKGLDLTIMIGAPSKDDGDVRPDSKSDLAPQNDKFPEEDNESPAFEAGEQEGMKEPMDGMHTGGVESAMNDHAGMEKALMGNMGPDEMKAMEGKKSKSLSERARMDAYQRMHKGK